ncbi:hypothetical protein BSPWISOXPB_11180 [uncultured Gammaproteobacteria bacterium]|nr:hypothetical protein BSPWISOXPB_11180 [uncultured Gammaproteobacteria bacterium]
MWLDCIWLGGFKFNNGGGFVWSIRVCISNGWAVARVVIKVKIDIKNGFGIWLF